MRVPKLCRNGDGRAFSIWPKSGGKREYFGPYGSPEASQNYAEWVSRVVAGYTAETVYSGTEITVVELAAEYLQYVKTRRYTRQHQQHIRRSVKGFAGLFGRCKGAEVGAAMMRTYRESLVKENTLSRLALNARLSAVKTFIRWCCENGRIPEDVFAKLAAVKSVLASDGRVKPESNVRAVSLQNVKLTLPYLPKRAADMLRVQYYCGMRPQDVRNLRWADIDQTHEVWIFSPPQHKNRFRGKDLTKAVPLPAQKILKEYLCSPDEWVFRSRNGKQIGPSELKRCIDAAIMKAAENGVVIEHWTPNQLRHTIGTEVRARYGTSAAQDYLGHSDANTTMIYAEQSLDVLRKVGQSIDEHLP